MQNLAHRASFHLRENNAPSKPGIKQDNLEHIQVVRYGAGADFVPHHDYFDIGLSATEALLQQGGNRIGSMLLYLNTPQAGGTTVFSDVEIDVVPQCGSALYFGYPNPDPSSLTLHAGAPVLAGEKWLATFFVRQSLMHRRPTIKAVDPYEEGRAHG
ncbi:prolyl hydroxylase family protein [Xanthomonas fragariae]|uniref:prolyl hydroxylase family protein n=1 Tax=Xanthomonas fragariae TaxID=48664 RepID=UPI0022AA7404|nr:2OG-Fe(II) oxygenase [Xanthomonas fragariae]WAT15247.1 2OG-Fe(II) oxygenase [Xanthomonas fragariae]